MKKLTTILIALTVMSGCHTAPVAESKLNDTFNPLDIKCDTPYVMTQDCEPKGLGDLLSPNRLISRDGTSAKITGSSDGKVIYLTKGHFFAGSGKDFIDPTSISRHTDKVVNNSYLLVKSILEEENINIKKTILVSFLSGIQGYYIELDGDGYSVLKKYSVNN